MTRRARRNHTPAFKAKVALAAVKGEKTLAVSCDPSEAEIHWRAFLDNLIEPQ